MVVAAAVAAIRPPMCAAQAQDASISIRQASQRTDFTDDEIKDGFFKTALRPELQFDRHVERIRKFAGPVRVFVINRSATDRMANIKAVLADIGARVRHLDIALTDDRDNANFIVLLIEQRNFSRTLTERYGEAKARQIRKRLDPQCLSGIAKDREYRISRAEVILPVDAGEFTFLDCAYEELLQALGIINDSSSVPWTMFNDAVQMGFFDVYDQYLTNILYDPRVRPGMSRDELNRLLPNVLPTVRTWIRQTNVPRAAELSGSSSARQ